MKHYILQLVLASGFLFIHCKRIPSQKAATVANVVKVDKTQIETIYKSFELKPIIDTSISAFVDQNAKYACYLAATKEFYKKRNGEYAWFSKEGITPRIDMFLNLINGSEHSLSIVSDTIVHDYNHIREDSSVKRAQYSLQNLELKLTLTFFEFADKEWAGCDEKLLKKLEWYIPKKKLKYQDVLDSLLKNDSKDVSLFKAPIYEQYDLLKNYLHRYKEIEDKGGWIQIFANKKAYKLGDTSKVISLIKKRLYITGDLPKSDTLPVFDSTMALAVRNFQKRFGMKEDGKVGALVLKEMNTPIEQRLVQIIINMERCRWVPFDLKGEYFIVNIPEFKLHAYQGNKCLWDMNVVVGKATTKTVIFIGNLQYIVLNPYWVVTSNIFTKEFVPKLRKNAGYLKSQDMELAKANTPDLLLDPATINWNLSESHYHNLVARQRPGVNNALGKVKFIFPNQYSIYLHDTPSKSLFSESNRSFSHGCIRVEKPEALAKFLLRDDPNWTDKNLQRAWDKKTEQYVPLKKKIPVIIAYFTAWVDENGKVNFRNDIYGHDAKMSKLLIDRPQNQIISVDSKSTKK